MIFGSLAFFFYNTVYYLGGFVDLVFGVGFA